MGCVIKARRRITSVSRKELSGKYLGSPHDKIRREALEHLRAIQEKG